MIRPRPEEELLDDSAAGSHANPDYLDWLSEIFELIDENATNPHHVILLTRIARGTAEIPEEWLAK